MAKLKELRSARGISQQELAELVGVSRQTISRWENEIVQPSADNLMCLSEVLQFPLEAFLRDDWEPPEQQAVEAVAILPKEPQDTDAEESPESGGEVPPAPPEEIPVPGQEVAPKEAVTPLPVAPAKARRLPLALICAGVVCALLIAIAALAGVHSINQRLEPDNIVPVEEIEVKEVDEVPSMHITFHP